MPEKIVATPRDDYRFRIATSEYSRTPRVSLEVKRVGRWKTKWVEIEHYGTLSMLRDIESGETERVDVKDYVERVMNYMWAERLKKDQFYKDIDAYWQDDGVHADFVLAGVLEAGAG